MSVVLTSVIVVFIVFGVVSVVVANAGGRL
jgi:hypothetical protein